MFPSRCAGVEHFLLKVIANLSDMDLIINTRDYPQCSEYFGSLFPIFSFSKVSDNFLIDSGASIVRKSFRMITFDESLAKVEQFTKYIYRHHSIMILCIQHGHFGKVVQLSRCILVALADGINIVNP